jgi:hypothetical protein
MTQVIQRSIANKLNDKGRNKIKNTKGYKIKNDS